jgi:hypothetical protein
MHELDNFVSILEPVKISNHICYLRAQQIRLVSGDAQWNFKGNSSVLNLASCGVFIQNCRNLYFVAIEGICVGV